MTAGRRQIGIQCIKTIFYKQANSPSSSILLNPVLLSLPQKCLLNTTKSCHPHPMEVELGVLI